MTHANDTNPTGLSSGELVVVASMSKDYADVRHVSEDAYHQASFLDDRGIPASSSDRRVVLHELLEHPQPTNATAAIFHIGHCGSTLVSRALSIDRNVLPVREPQLLNLLAFLTRLRLFGGTSVDRLDDLARFVHGHLSRRFRQEQSVVMKPSSISTILMSDYLERHPGNQALFLTIPLEEFVAVMCRNQRELVDFANRHFTAELGDLTERLTPGQQIRERGELAAATWLVHARHCSDAMSANPDRVRLLDFNRFLEDPRGTTRDLGAGLKIPCRTDERLDTLLEAYSKNPAKRFGPSDRADMIRDLRTEFAVDILSARRFLDRAGQRLSPTLHTDLIASLG